MSHFYDNHQIFNLPVRLNGEQRKDPHKVFQEFFEYYNLCSVREILWEMVETCLTAEGSTFDDHCERDGLLHLYNGIESVIEAVYLLNEARKLVK